MKIGIVADTHSHPLPVQMLNDFKKVDMIIYAGDFCSLAVLKALKDVKEVKAVYGNMDGADIRAVFPRSQILKFEEILIGLFHGEGARQTILETVKSEFAGQKVDAVIFGHSHQPLNEVIDKVLYFNPGSPNDKVFAPYCSYGILEVHHKEVRGSIIKVKEGK